MDKYKDSPTLSISCKIFKQLWITERFQRIDGFVNVIWLRSMFTGGRQRRGEKKLQKTDWNALLAISKRFPPGFNSVLHNKLILFTKEGWIMTQPPTTVGQVHS